MKKLIAILASTSLLLIPSIAYAKNNKDKPSKTYKNIALQMKSGNVIYRMSDIVPSLGGSTQRVNNNALINLGYTGQGATVAVIDTGVDFTHSFLSNAKAGEACFTMNASCPNNSNTMLGDGAARPVHWHGTHVAGIIAGSNSTMNGIAPGAKIFAVNIFEKDGNAYEQSIYNALEYINSVRVKYNIVSVNLSLGTTKMWTTTCDDVSPEITQVIKLLIQNNVAVVAAAGNSYSYGMANPACISGVVSVAASYSTNDNVTEFSNISNYTTFAAPGYLINSSVPSNAYKQSSGTSMSTPHVAGAFALYKSFKPDLSATAMVSNLKANCPKAYDAPTKISVCRLDFTYIATGETSNDTTTTTSVPVTTTSVQPPTDTLPPDTTTSTTIVWRTTLGKPRLNGITLYRNNTAVVNYIDPVYGKSAISYYVLSCNNATYNFAPISGSTSHAQYIESFNPLNTQCSLYPVDANNNAGPQTQFVYVSK